MDLIPSALLLVFVSFYSNLCHQLFYVYLHDTRYHNKHDQNKGITYYFSIKKDLQIDGSPLHVYLVVFQTPLFITKKLLL